MTFRTLIAPRRLRLPSMPWIETAGFLLLIFATMKG